MQYLTNHEEIDTTEDLQDFCTTEDDTPLTREELDDFQRQVFDE